LAKFKYLNLSSKTLDPIADLGLLLAGPLSQFGVQ